ncbi:MAG: YjjG family noncanonical pyrimidine nucleotidase [Faecalibacterium sp.]|nr:YjjG family noncanonical pyrimidine nucleotidase [Faecalibacterium sp.]
MANYYCILFDADNTLLDFDAAENKALLETLQHYDLPTEAAVMETYRQVNSSLWAALERGEIRREKLMSERFARFLKAIGREAKGNKGAEMNQYYLDRLASHPDLMPQALEALRELAEVATLAVATNGFQRVQMQRSQESGIAQYMEEIFVSEKLGCDKPDRKFFDVALRQLGVENRQRVLVVGDSLNSDIKGGINAGLDTCWYNPAGKQNRSGITPTYEISSLTELYNIVMEQEELDNVGIKNRKHSL